MVAMREHRFPFLHKVGEWNRLTANTGGTLVEKTCHFFDLMNVIVQERPVRVMASGAQDVNHLDEVVDGRRADMLDNAFVIVDYPGGARAMLDLCMFAEATHHQEELSVVGAAGKVEALLPEGTVRVGVRGRDGIGRVESYPVDDAGIAHRGLHHGSSFVEHERFRDAVVAGGEPEVTVDRRPVVGRHGRRRPPQHRARPAGRARRGARTTGVPRPQPDADRRPLAGAASLASAVN